MNKKRIVVELSSAGIERAIKELDAYKRSVRQNEERLRKAIASKIEVLAQSGFNGAIVDDLIHGEKRTAQVTVTTLSSGNTEVVIADGEDAVWVEFGAGVYHNGSAGNSPHPHGAELGFTIGSYGKHGKERSWGFVDEAGLHITRGTEAKMPMNNALVEVINSLPTIAREVWK